MVEMEGADELIRILESIAERTDKVALAIAETEGEEDQAAAIRDKLFIQEGIQEALPLIKVETEAQAKDIVDQGYPVPEYLSKDLENYIVKPLAGSE